MYRNEPENPSVDGHWPTIIPFDDHPIPDAEPPLDSLPQVLSEFVREISRVVDVSPELALGMTVPTLTGCLGTFVVVKVGETHEETMAHWSVAVCPPGERKTAVQGHVSAPILEWEAEQAAKQKEEFASWKAEVALIEAQIKKIESKVKNGTQAERTKALDQIRELRAELPTRPRLRRLILQDVTAEAIPRHLQETGGPALILDDEGGIFTTVTGRYGKTNAANLDALLKGHAGSTIRVDRVGRESNNVDHPAISLAITVQPHVIESMGATSDLQGRGFTQRIAFIFARPRAGHRVYRALVPNNEVITNYKEVAKGLLDLAQTAERPGSFVLTLKDEALEAYRKFHNDVEVLMRPGGILEDIKEWAGKLSGMVARIAGMFHLVAASGIDQIDKRWVEAAIDYARYLIPHALAAQVVLSLNAKQAAALSVLRSIRDRGEARVSTRDIHQRLRKSLTPFQIDEACRNLEERGYVAELPVESEKSSRRRSLIWRVNPAVFKVYIGTPSTPGTQNDLRHSETKPACTYPDPDRIPRRTPSPSPIPRQDAGQERRSR